MENNPLVSIIVPMYNAEKYIDECLMSCITQTYHNIEVIVINDGSTDNCDSIVNRYVATDKRVKYFQQENKGIPLTRLAGITASKGDYITWVDSDDSIVGNAVEVMVREVIRHNADMLFTDFYRFTDDGQRSEHLTNTKKCVIENGMEYLEAQINNYMWAKLYRREVSLNLVPQTVNMIDDYFFNLQILPRCKKVVYLNQYLYFYRYNPDSVMNNKPEIRAKEFLEHAIQRMPLIDKGTYTQKVKEIILFDNIRMLHRCFIYLEYNDRIKELIEITYERYRFSVRDFKRFKMGLFLFMAKFTPRLAQLYHQLNRTKQHEN